MIADAEHSMSTGVQELVPSMSTFIHSVLADITFPTVNWTLDDDSGNITLYYYGNTSQIVDVRRWEARSCADKRRDFRVINLDNPCLCGADVSDGEYCFNVESLFLGENLDAISVTNDKAVYFASPNEIPDRYWIATMISIRVKLFEVEYLSIFCGL